MEKKIDLEELYLKCKESVEDVTGWKVFIFLPQHFIWRLIILATVFFTYVMRAHEFSFGLIFPAYEYVEFVCTVLYFADTICASLHYKMVKTRSLRHGKKRHLICLTLDYLSLIPFQLFHTFFIHLEHNVFGELLEKFRINVCLRIYQLFLFFFETRFAVYKMKVYFILVIVQVTLGLTVLTHCFSCIYFLLLTENSQKKCLKDPMNCVIEIELLTFSFFSQSYVEPSFSYPASESALFTIFTFITGFFLTYGYLLPMMFFSIYYYLMGLIEFSNRCRELDLLIDNLTESKSLKSKIVKYLQTVWVYGKGSRRPEILKLFPKCIQKDIFCDVHWEAFKHSQFLEGISLGCKRSLSLRMKMDFVLPNTTLLDLNETKINFIYLESGLIQLMAEENDSIPILSFSGGTVLGEISFFYQLGSKAILRTGKLSVVHFLSWQDFLKVSLDYPKDMRKVFGRMKFRLMAARATHVRKTQIFPHFMEETDSQKSKERGNVKWLKGQFRAVLNLQEIYGKDLHPIEKDLAIQRQTQELHTQMEHTSLFLSLITVNHEIINKYEFVCLSSRCPWLINPQSSFLSIWNYLIIFFSFASCIIYPIFIGWFPQIPIWFFNLTVVTTFLYILDVFITLLTAIRVKNVVVSEFGTVLTQKLTSMSFYVDVVAALPLQVFKYFDEDRDRPYVLGLYLVNSLLKVYKVIAFSMEWNYKNQSKPFKRVLLKHFFFLCVSTYWLGALFKLSGIECIWYDCGDGDWYQHYVKTREGQADRNVASIYLMIFVGMDFPYEIFTTDVFASYVLFFLSYYYYRLYFFIWLTECTSSFVLERIYVINYQSLINVVHFFMNKRRISGRIPNRVIDTMKFQWYYDRGNYLTQENRIIDDIPTKLRDEMDKDSLFRTLQLCPLFKTEDESFILDMCRTSQRIALPANSVLITFGTQTMSLYVVHKGFVQLNSFLSKDAIGNVGTPIILSSGDVFPIIIAFNQIPSILTARTISDCELIILNLEEILSAMVVHEVFKDIVDSLKNTDLKPLTLARPGLSIVGDTYKTRGEIYQTDLSKFKYLLKSFLLRKSIDAYGKRYMQWEVFRLSCILFGLLVWPFAFGCLAKSDKKKYLIYFLMVVDSTAWIDFFIRSRLSFYNGKGIYITNPLSTFLHYFSTSFVLDLIAFLPHLHFIYFLHNGIFHYGQTVIATHLAARLASFYKVFGFFDYLNNKFSFIYNLEFLKYILLGIILLNSYVNFSVYSFVIGKFRFDSNLNSSSPTYEIYFHQLSLHFQFILRIKYLIYATDSATIAYVTIFNLLGWLTEILCTAYLILAFIGPGINFSNYQYFLKSFRKFLNLEKIEDKFIREAVEYYEHVWIKKRGVEFEKIFSRFPAILQEDLFFSVYKTTLSSVSCLSQANEAFYRTLSKNVEEVYLKKGSTVTFRGQVKSDIFFVHKGRCGVRKMSAVLCKGSMIGDIRGEGLIKHTIYAKTHVILLKISSGIFFLTIDNFSHTKSAYEKEVSQFDDFVKSSYEEEKEEEEEEEEEMGEEDTNGVRGYDLTEKMTNQDFEAKYEPIGAKKPRAKVKQNKRAEEDDQVKGIIDPNSSKFRILNVLFHVDSILTTFLIPIFVGIRSVAVTTLVITYFLDLIWILKIAVTLRTAISNPKTGILVRNRKAIFRRYLLQLDGFVPDLLSVLPIELIPYIYNLAAGREKTCAAIFYILRSLRYLYIQQFYRKEKKRLSINCYLRWFYMLLLKLYLMNFCACIILILYQRIPSSECHKTLNFKQWEAIQYGYTCMINMYCGAGLKMCEPKNSFQIYIEMLILFCGFYSKITLYVEGAVAINLVNHCKFQQTSQMEELEKYLKVRDISPALLIRIKKYFVDLTDFCKEGAMPLFLKLAPDFVKYNVIGDLYVHHLSGCFLFAGQNESFLIQLAIRLERCIFFPGNCITEKGDVDHNMYFIHKGEVYCLEEDENYPTLERPVLFYAKDECFGLMQGLFPCHPHAHTYRAKTLSEILVLNFKDWEDMRLAYPEVTKVIYDKAMQSRVIYGNN